MRPPLKSQQQSPSIENPTASLWSGWDKSSGNFSCCWVRWGHSLGKMRCGHGRGPAAAARTCCCIKHGDALGRYTLCVRQEAQQWNGCAINTCELLSASPEAWIDFSTLDKVILLSCIKIEQMGKRRKD